MLRSIPFQEHFKEAVLSGRKTATSRPYRVAYPGDTFEAFGATFVVDSRERLPLGAIARDHYQEEGCESPEEFIRLWQRLHPRAGFDPLRSVDFYRFHMKGAAFPLAKAAFVAEILAWPSPGS